MGRLVEFRLSAKTRAALSGCAKGRALLFDWHFEKSRQPSMPGASFPSPLLAYDYYASMVTHFGSPFAREALRRGALVLLALRKQSSTLAHHGRGSYDDQIVVLNGFGKARSAHVFPACTEPGAQYAQRSAPKGAGTVDARYAGVAHSKSDGVDIDHDGVKDAGRLIAGTYRYYEKAGGHVGARAFKVHATQIVERDTDGDGRFTEADLDRIDKKGAGTSMYIHRGGADDGSGKGTWSAGCQTVPKQVYGHFLAALGKPSFFYYVLVNLARAG